MQEIESIYLFYVKSWGQYYYPGWCFKIKGEDLAYYIAEKGKKSFFVKDEGLSTEQQTVFLFPPRSQDKCVTREHYSVANDFHIYYRHVLDLKKQHANDYFGFSLKIKRAIEYVNDLQFGEYNILIKRGERQHQEESRVGEADVMQVINMLQQLTRGMGLQDDEGNDPAAVQPPRASARHRCSPAPVNNRLQSAEIQPDVQVAESDNEHEADERPQTTTIRRSGSDTASLQHGQTTLTRQASGLSLRETTSGQGQTTVTDQVGDETVGQRLRRQTARILEGNL